MNIKTIIKDPEERRKFWLQSLYLIPGLGLELLNTDWTYWEDYFNLTPKKVKRWRVYQYLVMIGIVIVILIVI